MVRAFALLVMQTCDYVTIGYKASHSPRIGRNRSEASTAAWRAALLSYARHSRGLSAPYPIHYRGREPRGRKRRFDEDSDTVGQRVDGDEQMTVF